MKVLIVGDWHSELHEESVYQAFKQLGHESKKFSWHQYFESSGLIGLIVRPFLKAQNKYMLGPVVDRLNRDLISQAESQQPEMIFIYRGTHIYPETLHKLGKAVPGAVLAGYNNDDPFSPHYPKWKWRHFLASVPEYDFVLAYRLHNVDEFKAAGAKQVELLRSWFIPEYNSGQSISGNDVRDNFVIFAGHYEEDGRGDILNEVLKQGFDLKLYGPFRGFGKNGWDSAYKKYEYLRALPKPVWLPHDKYNETLRKTKIGLCFLSRMNRDTYTRRCFEIPSMGCALFSEYSDDLAEMFQEGREAEFFRNKNELIDKLNYYNVHTDKLDALRISGMNRVVEGGHDVLSRMKNVLKIVCPAVDVKKDVTK
jgi:spore maturation protein CgeB